MPDVADGGHIGGYVGSSSMLYAPDDDNVLPSSVLPDYQLIARRGDATRSA